MEETARGPQYADIKYLKDSNVTYTVATHRQDGFLDWNVLLELYLLLF
jgi:hypothetical protein